MIRRTVLIWGMMSGLGAALACEGPSCDACDGVPEWACVDISMIAGEHVTFEVEGVHCARTVSVFHHYVMEIDGIKAFSYRAGNRVELKFDPEVTSADAIVDAMGSGWFRLHPVDED